MGKGPRRIKPLVTTGKVYRPPHFGSQKGNDHLVSIGLTCDMDDDPPVVLGFMNRNYYYSSVTVQIPYDDVWVPIS